MSRLKSINKRDKVIVKTKAEANLEDLLDSYREHLLNKSACLADIQPELDSIDDDIKALEIKKLVLLSNKKDELSIIDDDTKATTKEIGSLLNSVRFTDEAISSYEYKGLKVSYKSNRMLSVTNWKHVIQKVLPDLFSKLDKNTSAFLSNILENVSITVDKQKELGLTQFLDTDNTKKLPCNPSLEIVEQK
jgi:hypothetical protein